MPTRMIREGVTTSEPLSAVSFEAECLFFRLLVVADDFGAFDGRPVIVRAKTMPLRDVTAAQIDAWLRELAEQALIVRYEVEGKPYVAIPKFKQRTRANSAKFPLPDDWTGADGQLTDNCPSSAGLVGGGGVVAFVSGGDSDGAGPLAQPPAILLPLVGGEEAAMSQAQVREFADLYRAVDVEAELRKMRGWLIANPANRKTKGGILRFVTRWLGQEQDKAARSGKPQGSTTPPVSGNSPAKPETAESKAQAAADFAKYVKELGYAS